MFDLSGKTALVAGGGGYLALPACIALAEHGAAVAVADISQERVERAVAELNSASPGGQALGLLLDVSEEAQVRETVEKTVEAFGGLDVMVNATLLSIGGTVEQLEAEEFDRANHVNITSTFVLARTAAEAMGEGGSIITYTSMYGLVAPDPGMYEPPMNPNPIEYGAGKAAICQMTRYLAAHYGPRGIRVNAIAPGAFPWPKTQQANPQFMQRLARRNMLGRIGRRDETAGAVLFLASDEASYVTGHVLRVDGGWTAW